MSQIQCNFCGEVIPKYTIDFAEYEKRNVSLFVCCECYDKVRQLIREGECDTLCEMRMAEIKSEMEEK